MNTKPFVLLHQQSRRFVTFSAIFGWLMTIGTMRAAEWQWAVETGTKNSSRAFLWIPPDCDYVRGVIVGQQVILEKVAFEDPQVRAVAARAKLAIVFIVPAAIGYDDFGPAGKGTEIFQGILERLAEVSGYSEIALAPFLTLGHSGGAIFAWRAAYWKPQRCFGVVGLHAAPIGPPEHKGQQTADGVPILDITGQYESVGNIRQGIEPHIRWVRGDLLAFRGRWEKALALKGDYYLIQFGHNDQPGKGVDRETDPATTYPQFMARYVDEARAIGAKPVLVTSLTRRDWNKSGDGKITSSLEPYVAAVKKVAAEKNVPLVDLHAASKALCEQLGQKRCNELSPLTTNGVDNTHLNAKGSKVFGRLVAEELVKAVPELTPCFHFDQPAK